VFLFRFVLFSAPISPIAGMEKPASMSTRPVGSRKNAPKSTAPTPTPSKVNIKPFRVQPHRRNDEELHEQEQPPHAPQETTLQQT